MQRLAYKLNVPFAKAQQTYAIVFLLTMKVGKQLAPSVGRRTGCHTAPAQSQPAEVVWHSLGRGTLAFFPFPAPSPFSCFSISLGP